MLNQLTVENFKAFGEKQTIPLAPITLVFGGNSAGKSSVIQAILLMRQSVGKPDRTFAPRPAELVVRGDLTDLGSFDALIHRHERDRELEVGWSSPLSANRLFGSAFSMHDSLACSTALRFQRTLRFTEIRHTGSSIGAADGYIDFERLDSSSSIGRIAKELLGAGAHPGERDVLVADVPDTYRLLQLSASLERQPRSTTPGDHDQPISLATILHAVRQNECRAVVTNSAGVPSRVVGLQTQSGGVSARDLARQRQSTLFDEDVILHGAIQLMDDWVSESGRVTRRAIGMVSYLGPMRQAPERLHVLSGEPVRGSGSRGQHVVDLLARRPSVLRDVNQWFTKLEIPYDLDIRTVTDKAVAGAIGEVHCLLLRDRRTGVEVAPTDVGFGIGQVLPIVVESVISREGTLCIEQPEIHLHPALQAKLGELFADRVQKGHQQFVLETHSEHLILRLQRLVRRGTLRPDQLAVLHVGADPDGQGRIRHLRLGENGDFLDEWPNGFFDERFDELFED